MSVCPDCLRELVRETLEKAEGLGAVCRSCQALHAGRAVVLLADATSDREFCDIFAAALDVRRDDIEGLIRGLDLLFEVAEEMRSEPHTCSRRTH